MLKLVNTVENWKSIQSLLSKENKSVGFVPTMGALHRGHESLIEKSSSENDITVVSIFVNSTQFNKPSDLINYPKNIEADTEILNKLKADFLFYPWHKEIYPDNYNYKIVENNLSKILCGKFRPGHFEGVLTVVMKLLNIIKPDRAYFGEKDFQQYLLIREMCKSFFIDVEIIACPTQRDFDGLALSSRNLLLSQEERILAKIFPSLLRSKKCTNEIKYELERLGIKVDYIEDFEGRRFGAVNIGSVRLIDNVQI